MRVKECVEGLESKANAACCLSRAVSGSELAIGGRCSRNGSVIPFEIGHRNRAKPC